MSSKNKELEKELKGICISLRKFLILYCNVYDETIYNKKMSHNDVKTLIPDLRRVSFQSLIGNKRSLYTGSIVAVMDSYGNVLPYIAPKIQDDFLPQFYDYKLDLTYDCDKKNKLEEIIISEDLSRYELVLLCKYYKNNNRIGEYRIANKLLKMKKGGKVKKYKKEKFNLEMKGREEIEEY